MIHWQRPVWLKPSITWNPHTSSGSLTIFPKTLRHRYLRESYIRFYKISESSTLTGTFKRPAPHIKNLNYMVLKTFLFLIFIIFIFLNIASSLSTKPKQTNQLKSLKLENRKTDKNKKTAKNNLNSWGTNFWLQLLSWIQHLTLQGPKQTKIIKNIYFLCKVLAKNNPQ